VYISIFMVQKKKRRGVSEYVDERERKTRKMVRGDIVFGIVHLSGDEREADGIRTCKRPRERCKVTHSDQYVVGKGKRGVGCASVGVHPVGRDELRDGVVCPDGGLCVLGCGIGVESGGGRGVRKRGSGALYVHKIGAPVFQVVTFVYSTNNTSHIRPTLAMRGRG